MRTRKSSDTHNMETPTLETPSVETVKPIILGKFGGAFSNFQISCFWDLKAAKLSAEVAHKIAFDYGSDIGNAFKSGDAELTSKVAKAKKDGSAKSKIAGGGSTRTSRTMSVYRAVQQIDSLYTEGLLASRELNVDTLTKQLREYIAECEEWAKDKTFTQG